MNTYITESLGAGNRPACDLRSDTLTRPDAAMRAAMAAAEVGDDVYGEDPLVNRLEAELAAELGKEAGLFLTSGTQSNLVAMMAHCGRGEEVIVGKPYHIYTYEAHGAGVLASLGLFPLDPQEDGGLDPQDVRAAIKDDGDSHYAISKLLCLENTHNGKATPIASCKGTADAARDCGLAVHLDGARFFNATTDLGCSNTDLASLADTVSICLSKGLGAPAGSVLVGPKDLVSRARRARKMLGGGMRQTGILAAAGLYALDHNVTRLADDQQRAEALAAQLTALGAGTVTQATNMVFFTPATGDHDALRKSLAQRGVLVGGGHGAIRMVLHKDVDDGALDNAIDGFRQHYGG